ncbi:hypothetical protein [Spiroplasma endosymbiont of Polydrusus pterygomalis]
MGYKHLGIDERIYIDNQLKFKKCQIVKLSATKLSFANRIFG